MQSKPASTIIDFEAAAQRITTDRIAIALLRLAGDESVRVIEALACSITNSLKSEGDIDQPFAYGRIQLLQYPRDIEGADRARMDTIKRISRRALRGTLCDHTRGSNAFHRIEVTPAWSKDILPVTVIGSFLFYRI